MATAVSNPLGGAGITNISAYEVSTWRKSVVRTNQAVQNTKLAFREKPWQSTAVSLSLMAALLQFIAFFVPWFHMSLSTSASSSSVAKVSLTTAYVCTVVDNPSYDSNGSVCAYVPLMDIAKALSWMYSASAASLAMLILGYPFTLLGFGITWLRRFATLERVPEKLGFLRKPVANVVIHGIAAFQNMLAFAIFSGMYNDRFNDSRPNIVSIITGNSIAGTRFDGGFALSIIVFLLSVTTAIICHFHHQEVRRAVPKSTVTEIYAQSNADTANVGGAYAAQAAQPSSPMYGAYGMPPLPPANVVAVPVAPAVAPYFASTTPVAVAVPVPASEAAANPFVAGTPMASTGATLAMAPPVATSAGGSTSPAIVAHPVSPYGANPISTAQVPGPSTAAAPSLPGTASEEMSEVNL